MNCGLGESLAVLLKAENDGFALYAVIWGHGEEW